MLVDAISKDSKVSVRMGKREQRWNDPEAHRALRKLYDERIVPTGMTQEAFGEAFGIGNQSMVWQYLSGTKPLSLDAAWRFAQGLRCTIHDFSPMLADQFKAYILPVLAPKSWWRGTGKALLLALAVALVLPSPQPAHASFSSHVASAVYFVKSWLRRFLTNLVRKRTFKVQVAGE